MRNHYRLGSLVLVLQYHSKPYQSYFNTRQTEEQAKEVKITKVFLKNDDEAETMDDKIKGKFILSGLTRNIEYKMSLKARDQTKWLGPIMAAHCRFFEISLSLFKVRIYLNLPDWERPGMMKELMRESYASEWKKAYTATKIYSGFFNFTKVMYEPYFNDDNRPETRETKTKMKEIFGRTITEIEQHYLSTGDLELIESPFNRTFGNMTFFVNMRSSTTAKSLSERIKNVWQKDNLGLDFHSIEISDYNNN